MVTALGNRTGSVPGRPRWVLVAAAAGLLIANGQTSALAADRAPGVVARSAWGAKPADTARMRAQTPREIVIHHTAVRQQPKVTLERKLQGLQSFSQKPGKVGTRLKPAWGDVPYHFYIDVTGRVGEGRSLAFAGDTNTRYDTTHRIQIVVEGDFEREVPSPRQLAALGDLVVWLAKVYAIAPARLSGHDDQAATSCPGKTLKPRLADLRARIAAGR